MSNTQEEFNKLESEIYQLRMAFMSRSSKTPTVIYLGSKQMNIIREYVAESSYLFQRRAPIQREEIQLLKIYAVDSSDHINVA